MILMIVGRGKYKVRLEKKKIGKETILFLFGGEKPHVGCVVIAEPKRKTKLIKFDKHKDHIVAKPIAEKFCKRTKRRVVCVGGIHVDNATKEEIKILVDNCKKIEERI